MSAKLANKLLMFGANQNIKREFMNRFHERLIKERCQAKLSDEEKLRLDNLLKVSRWFNYAAITLAGISLIISLTDNQSDVKIPLGEITIPRIEATAFIYLLVILFSIASDRFFELSKKWIEKDNRRVPFAWIALNSSNPSFGLVRTWIVIPILVCAFSTANSVPENGVTSYTLIFFAFIPFFLFRGVFQQIDLLFEKRDLRGGKVTYSIWLLYLFRLYRLLIITAFFSTPLVVILLGYEVEFIELMKTFVIALLPIQLIRIVCGHKRIYRYLDRKGASIGFSEKSTHYQ